MTHRVGLVKPLITLKKSIFLILIGLAAVGIGLIPWNCAGSSTVNDNPGNFVAPASPMKNGIYTLTISVNPDSWSKPIDVPMGWAFYIDATKTDFEWLEIRFWSGKTVRWQKTNEGHWLTDGKPMDQNRAWLGNVGAEEKCFYLRGGPKRDIVEVTIGP